MAELMELPSFCGGSYSERSIPFDSERCINLMPILGPQEAKSPLMLVRTPGLKLLQNISTDPIRGIKQANQFWYIVAGNKVFQIDLSLNLIQATGTLNTNGGLVSMAYNNNNQLAIVDGQNLYICTTGGLTPALTTITTNILGKPSTVCFLNQYFLISLMDSQQFQWSALNDGTTWSATDTDFATSSPDNLVAVAASNGYLYLLGEETTEVWSNNPTQITVGPTTISFPFNYTGTVIPFGLAGAHAFASINNGIAWLTNTITTSPHIIFAQGGSEQLISTPAIDQMIASYGTIGNAAAMVSHQRGNEVFILSFPSADSTLCYDFQTKMFHERSSFNGKVWVVSCVSAFGPNTEIAGDSITGNIYYLDPKTYNENGVPLVCVRTTPPFATNDNFNFCYDLLLEFQPGVGNPNPPANDPSASIECSTDYGFTFDNARQEKIGKQGKYLTRVHWHRFGAGRSFVFRLTCSESVPIVIIKAWVDVETGDA